MEAQTYGKRWLLVANSEKAMVYEIMYHEGTALESVSDPLSVANKPHYHAQLLHEWQHPEARLQEHELKTDKPGIYRQGMFVGGTNAQTKEKNKFAQEVAKRLIEASQNKNYKELFLCVEKKFYGMLKKHLSKAVEPFIKKVVQKDYVFHHTEILNGQFDLKQLIAD